MSAGVHVCFMHLLPVIWACSNSNTTVVYTLLWLFKLFFTQNNSLQDKRWLIGAMPLSVVCVWGGCRV